MSTLSIIHEVFGHFQNLNLLWLLHDLRNGRAAREAWFTGSLLCPIAHGLPAGQQVRELTVLGQAADMEGCDYAARHLGANPDAVLRFVRSWDEGLISREWLMRQLEEMWQERLTDAEFMQELLKQELENAGLDEPCQALAEEELIGHEFAIRIASERTGR